MSPAYLVQLGERNVVDIKKGLWEELKSKVRVPKINTAREIVGQDKFLVKARDPDTCNALKALEQQGKLGVMSGHGKDYQHYDTGGCPLKRHAAFFPDTRGDRELRGQYALLDRKKRQKERPDINSGIYLVFGDSRLR